MGWKETMIIVNLDLRKDQILKIKENLLKKEDLKNH